MSKFYNTLSDELQQFISEQHIFFVATAPKNGRLNLSPKGMDAFHCINNKRVMFLNGTGSGNETAAHLAENGRLTIMFCSFDKRPLILRLYGNGRAIHPRDAEWNMLYAQFHTIPGTRQILEMEIDSVQTSCGFAVPFYEYQGERKALRKWAESRSDEEIRDYWVTRNQVSIDGLPTHIVETGSTHPGLGG
jgi:hypothetical protein